MAVPNHAVLRHRYGSFAHGASQIQRTAIPQTTAGWAWPRLLRNLRANCHRSCNATARLDERVIAVEKKMQATFQDLKPAHKGCLTLAAAMAGWLGSCPGLTDCALAAEDSEAAAVATEAASRAAPEWVTPVVLGVPFVMYLLFALYRNQVNPEAKLTDLAFGIAAVAIIGNLILIATVGGKFTDNHPNVCTKDSGTRATEQTTEK